MKRPSKATSTADAARRTRYRLVGGKGGVGKTTCAAGIALDAAAAGARTLLLSTDPAPSLADALRVPLGSTPKRVPGARALHAAEVNAAAVIRRWLAPRTVTLKEIALRGTWLDEDDVSRLLDLSLPGIDEIAGLLEVLACGRSGEFDLVVVDTAPTGHTLRMLSMPHTLEGVAAVFDAMQAKHRAMVEALRGEWRPDAADALIGDLDRDAGELTALLTDPERLTASWVTLPEPMAIAETLDAVADLQRRGVALDTVIINRRVPEPDPDCDWCAARDAFERAAVRELSRVSRTWPAVRTVTILERDAEPRGLRALASIGVELRARVREPVRKSRGHRRAAGREHPTPRVEIFDVASARLVMFGGKGGVGKTTCAAAAALDAATCRPNRRILLLSTDPAHSLADALGERLDDRPRRLSGGPSNMYVRELDAGAAFARVREQYGDAIDSLFDRLMRGSALDAAFDRRIMHALIDLAPPGLDELVAILEVTEALRASQDGERYDIVVMDTAPSGHALRLLEMPGLVHDWVKALMSILLKYQPVGGVGSLGAVLVRLSQELGRLRVLLTNKEATRFVPVTRPAALPRMETLRLLRHMRASRIPAPVVLLNAIGRGTCLRCRRAIGIQERERQALRRALAAPKRGPRPTLVIAPAEMPPPMGAARLRRWRREWRK